jgi:hypothetical protein
MFTPMLMAKRTGLMTSNDSGGEDDAPDDRWVPAACAESLLMIMVLRRRGPAGNQWIRPKRSPWHGGLGGDFSVVQPGFELAKLLSMA